jgi:hypothetical protein
MQLCFIFAQLINGEHKVILDISEHDSRSLKSEEIRKTLLDAFDEVTLRSLGANLSSQLDSIYNLLLHGDLGLDSNQLFKLEFNDGSYDACDFFINEIETLVYLLLKLASIHDILLFTLPLINVLSLICSNLF